MKDNMPLNELQSNEMAKVKKIILDGSIKRRLLDLGLIENTVIKSLYKSPFGDPTAYFFRGTVIALRREIASKILIERAMGVEDV